MVAAFLSPKLRAAAAAAKDLVARKLRLRHFRAAETASIVALALLVCWNASTRMQLAPATKPGRAAEAAASHAAAELHAADAIQGSDAAKLDASGAVGGAAAGNDGEGSADCPVRYEQLSLDEVARDVWAPSGRRPYLFGAPSRPGCANCERTDKLWSNFCQFKSHGPVCEGWVRQGILASWVARRYELPLTMTPCDLWAHIRGRTLLLMGDSMMLDFFKAVQCFMFEFWPTLEEEPFSANSALQAKLECSTVRPHCARLVGGTRICYVRQDKGPGFYDKALPLLLESGLVSPRDIMVANFGLHYGEGPGYAQLARRLAAYYTQHAARLPRLFWQQTVSQHFDTPGGLYPGGSPPFKCKPLVGYSVQGDGRLVLEPGRTDGKGLLTGLWHNAAADAVMRAAGIPIIQSYNDSVPMWRAHRDNECTHYCHPAAPQMFVAHLLRALREDGRVEQGPQGS